MKTVPQCCHSEVATLKCCFTSVQSLFWPYVYIQIPNTRNHIVSPIYSVNMF